MAKQPPEDKFLGGGLAFNSVGSAPSDPDPTEGDSGPIRIPSRLSPQTVRTLVILAFVLLLAVFLSIVRDSGRGGVIQTHGRGVSPTDRPTGPPKNF